MHINSNPIYATGHDRPLDPSEPSKIMGRINLLNCRLDSMSVELKALESGLMSVLEPSAQNSLSEGTTVRSPSVLLCDQLQSTVDYVERLVAMVADMRSRLHV